ncbi:MAG TPA: DUF3341 domain-containing protein [Rariglobus sp.]|jgi:hypothetical protein|nr:DUF3341 domain-containing protein [Rariglobus sp.]
MAEQPYGLIATFDTAAGVYHAAESVRDAGYKNWDCITPYPVHGLDKAMGLKRSLVPVFSLAGGIAGVFTAVGLIFFTGAIDYKLVLAGRPFFSPIPAVPIIVELGIALSAFSAVAGMIVLCRFPMLYHPVLKSDRIISALDDKYLIVIEARDPMFSPTQTKALLEKMGGQDVKELEA